MVKEQCPIDRPWTWESVADWQDTEGFAGIYMKENGYKYAKIGIDQKERKPLDGICAFLKKQKIRCYVYHDKKKGFYRMAIDHKRSAKEYAKRIIKLVRLKKTCEQMQNIIDLL